MIQPLMAEIMKVIIQHDPAPHGGDHEGNYSRWPLYCHSCRLFLRVGPISSLNLSEELLLEERYTVHYHWDLKKILKS